MSRDDQKCTSLCPRGYGRSTPDSCHKSAIAFRSGHRSVIAIGTKDCLALCCFLSLCETKPVPPLRSGLRLRIFLRFLDRLSPSTRGIIAMLGAMATFACGDALMKSAAGRLPLGEALFVRGVIATLLIWAVAARTGVLSSLPHLLHGTLLWRTLGDTGASFFYVSALGRIPLADAAAIAQTNPLAVTACAALFLGERVGWRRWSATAVGFLGVLMIIQPGSSAFTWASLLVVASVLSVTMRDIVTRSLTDIPVVLIIGAAATTTTVLSAVLGISENWHVPATFDLLTAMSAGVLLLAGQYLVVVSIRTGDMSAVVPFRYSHIVWTLLISFTVWHYLPNPLALFGIFVVSTAGLYTFFREQTLRRQGRL